MKIKEAVLELKEIEEDEVLFNMVFLNTGEIKQKRRSKEWLMKRVFYHEIRTHKRKYGETIEYDYDREEI